MRRKLFSICSVLLVLVVSVAVLVPGCDGTTPEEQCIIVVKATLDDAGWTGPVRYNLTGPAGTSSISGTSVEDTFDVECGEWTCTYDSGGPAGATLVSITPSATQDVSDGGTITFTLNFETPPPVDASVEFETWTINGQPVQPGFYWVGPNTIIDIEYKVHVSGEEEGALVTVRETDWFGIHYWGIEDQPGPSMWVHIVNAPGAVWTTPPSTLLQQDVTVEGAPASPCDEIELPYCNTVWFDLETVWQQKVCTQYTKTINWLGIPSPEEIVLDLLAPPEFSCYVFYSYACVEVDGDTDPNNNCANVTEEELLAICYLPQ